jgi:transposase
MKNSKGINLIMAKPYSLDIRSRVISKHKEGKAVTEIIKELDVKRSFVYDMLTLYKATGSVEPKPASGGRKPTIDEEILLQIETLVLETPDITLQEIKDELELTISISIICDAINKKLNLRYKKNSFRYRPE